MNTGCYVGATRGTLSDVKIPLMSIESYHKALLGHCLASDAFGYIGKENECKRMRRIGVARWD
uniref:Uncharacterized protein n=1 Tax=Anopheles funestus TaxID=62324 RepID=A0A182S4G4_ANOFN